MRLKKIVSIRSFRSRLDRLRDKLTDNRHSRSSRLSGKAGETARQLAVILVLLGAVTGISVIADSKLYDPSPMNLVDVMQTSVITDRQPKDLELVPAFVLMQPSETGRLSFHAATAPFSRLYFDVRTQAAQAPFEQTFHVRLTHTDTGKIYSDRDVSVRFEKSAEGNTQNIMLLPEREGESVFPPGDYRMELTVRPDDPPLGVFVSSVWDGTAWLAFRAFFDSPIGVWIERMCLILAGFFLFVSLSYLFLHKKGRKFTAERFFLLCVIPLSLVYLLLFTPWQVPDSDSHFLAAYRFSNLLLGQDGAHQWYGRADDAAFFRNVWLKGDPGMKDILSYYGNFAFIASDETMVPMGTSEKMTFYSLFSYLPQAVGITLGRLTHLGTVPMLFLTRMLTLSLYITACLHAIRVTPVGKFVFAAIAVFPYNLMLGGSLSYDVMVIIGAFCLVANILRLYGQSGEEGGQSWNLYECMCWAFIVGAVKGGGGLVLLFLLPLLLWKKSIARLRQSSLISAAGFGSILLFNVVLAHDSLFQFGTQYGYYSASLVYTDPITYFRMLCLTYIRVSKEMIFNLGGNRMGAYMLEYISPGVIAAMMLSAGFYSVFEKDTLSFRRRDRIVLIGVIALYCLGVPMMLLSWTPLCYDYVIGLQGRYFLPVLPLGYLAITKFKTHRLSERNEQTPEVLRHWCLLCFTVLSWYCSWTLIKTILTS